MITNIVNRLLGRKPDEPRWVIRTRDEADEIEYRVPRGRFRRAMLVNLPFLVGLTMVGALIALTVLAPTLAPHNPYAISVDQRFVEQMGNPPYPPSDLFPLGTDRFGRDMLSMLLYGASTTLVAASAITIARLLIGLALGAIAGWFQSGLVDGIIMSVARFLSAFPILLAGMILILALDIRQGLQVFVVALALVGWSELAQYIRSEFMTIKQQPFIESARAVGLTGFGIAVRHVLPNVVPSLIALLALEMGGVLMLLGELGFLSIFVGGGAFTTDAMDQAVHYATVPEWGAMLAGTRLYARTYPWLALSPAMAFFWAIVGFNLLGEGFRRIIEESGVNIALLISKRALVGVGLLVVALWVVRENTGPLAAYASMTDGFVAANVVTETETLTTGEMAVRMPGSPGCDAAAAYIARRFKELGLQPWGDNWETYLQQVQFEVTELGEVPRLAMLPRGPDGTVAHEFVYRQDFREQLHKNNGPGKIQAASVTFLGLNPQRPWKINIHQRSGRSDPPPGIGSGMVMILEENEPYEIAPWLRGYRSARQPVPGLLIVTRNPNRVQQQGVMPVSASMTTNFLDFDYRYSSSELDPTPTCYITEETADRLLAPQGLGVSELRRRMDDMVWDRESGTGDSFIIEPLPISVTMSVPMSPTRRITATNVIGFLPGSDTVLDEELVIVAAHYDGLSMPPGGGAPAPGAVDNAASVATMFEIVRLWQEQGFQPRRTILFAVFPGGESSLRAVERFKSHHTILQTLQPVAFVQLDSLAGGSGNRLLISDLDFRLHALTSRAAGKLGVGAELEHVDYFNEQSIYDVFFALNEYNNVIGPPHRYFALPLLRAKIPTITLRWEGSEDLTHRAGDSAAALDPDKVSRAGRVLDLMLRILTRETLY